MLHICIYCVFVWKFSLCRVMTPIVFTVDSITSVPSYLDLRTVVNGSVKIIAPKPLEFVRQSRPSPQELPPSPQIDQEQILASTYKISSLIFLRNLPSLCSAALRYFSISPLQRNLPSFCPPPIGLSRLYSIRPA